MMPSRWLVLVLAACGSSSSSPDAGPAVCGNLIVETGETCDGECPTGCDDADPCTADALGGSECTTECTASPITDIADGDGCCPAGGDANTDDDCGATCSNGVLESGERCDPGITAGAGACPTACDDAQACTTNTLANGGSCQAMCAFIPITAPINNDTCCPSGATSTNDNDCVAGCGNGVKGAGETCDIAISGGPDACPTSCNDNVACTTNVLSNPGTCTAACSYLAITMAINGDGCCPPGANGSNDNDCAPVSCGDSSGYFPPTGYTRDTSKLTVAQIPPSSTTKALQTYSHRYFAMEFKGSVDFPGAAEKVLNGGTLAFPPFVERFSAAYLTVTRCPGDLRPPLAASATTDPTRARGCRIYLTTVEGSLMSWDFSNTGAPADNTCNLDPNVTYWFNFVLDDPAGGLDPTQPVECQQVFGEPNTTKCGFGLAFTGG